MYPIIINICPLIFSVSPIGLIFLYKYFFLTPSEITHISTYKGYLKQRMKNDYIKIDSVGVIITAL